MRRAKRVRGSRGQMTRRKLGGSRGQGAGRLYGYLGRLPLLILLNAAYTAYIMAFIFYTY